MTVIHINETGEGKSIKNKRSERFVPLTDGAYGFDLAAFLRYVETCRLKGAESLAQIGYKTAGEWANQQAIPAALGDSFGPGLTFHSLRHSLASLMQAKGAPRPTHKLSWGMHRVRLLLMSTVQECSWRPLQTFLKDS